MVITYSFHFCLTQDVLSELLVPNIKYICKHVFLGFFFFRKTCVLKVVIRYKKQLYSYIYLQTTIYQVKEP